jgi:hypothetical protein
MVEEQLLVCGGRTVGERTEEIIDLFKGTILGSLFVEEQRWFFL